VSYRTRRGSCWWDDEPGGGSFARSCWDRFGLCVEISGSATSDSEVDRGARSSVRGEDAVPGEVDRKDEELQARLVRPVWPPSRRSSREILESIVAVVAELAWPASRDITC